MMHGHGTGPGGMLQWQDMLTNEMWEKMTDEQKKVLIRRMIDSRIMMKENWIRHLEYKIETFKMARKMVDEW